MKRSGRAGAAYSKVRQVAVRSSRTHSAATWTPPRVKAGTTIFLGVNVEGALFSIGDGHYAQSEGETCGVAVEGAMWTTCVVDVIKKSYVEWPRLENDAFLMVAGSVRPLKMYTELRSRNSSAGSPPSSASRRWTRINWCPKSLRRKSPTSSIPTTQLHDGSKIPQALSSPSARRDGRRSRRTSAHGGELRHSRPRTHILTGAGAIFPRRQIDRLRAAVV